MEMVASGTGRTFSSQTMILTEQDSEIQQTEPECTLLTLTEMMSTMLYIINRTLDSSVDQWSLEI